ncbi:MAG: cytochrome c [Methylococcaceae bacterium]|nr:cytochrome c [Methylococcaceae bacterium]
MTQAPFILAAMGLLAGCSREYAPDSQATGEQIFQSACLECHKPATNGSIYTLKARNANVAFIADKVHGGSLLMPSFPNMKADDLTKVSTYALEHSAVAGE